MVPPSRFQDFQVALWEIWSAKLQGQLPVAVGMEWWDQAGMCVPWEWSDASAQFESLQEIYNIEELLGAFKMDRMSKAIIG